MWSGLNPDKLILNDSVNVTNHSQTQITQTSWVWINSHVSTTAVLIKLHIFLYSVRCILITRDKCSAVFYQRLIFLSIICKRLLFYPADSQFSIHWHNLRNGFTHAWHIFLGSFFVESMLFFYSLSRRLMHYSFDPIFFFGFKTL